MNIPTLAKNSRKLVQNLDVYVTRAIEAKEKQLVDLNRNQLKVGHKTAKDEPVSPKYRSAAYANFKGFYTPDLYLTGSFHEKMFLRTDGNEYLISSHDTKTPKLAEKYKDIFGIAPSNQPKAKRLTSQELIKIVKRVLYA